MMNNFFMGPGFGFFHSPFFLLLSVWSLFWKGLALWHSSQRKQPWWFVILFLVNTAGILEIVYLFGVVKLKFSELFQMSAEKQAVSEDKQNKQENS